MADEEFITLDDDELAEEPTSQGASEQESHQERQPPSKLFYLIVGFLVLLLILLITFGVMLYLKKHEPKEIVKEVNATQIVETIQEKTLTSKEYTQAQSLIQTADKLYREGKKEEALKIYEDLSLYNKSLSFYNIGVAKLKELKYQEAIEAFDESIKSDRLKTPSALNAAIANLHMQDQGQFITYLNLAEKYLPLMLNTPLYSYYIALIHHYKSEPFETLLTLENPTSDYYQAEKSFLSAKTFALVGNYNKAVDYINRINDPQNAFAVGQLYAKANLFELASGALQSAVNQKLNPPFDQAALALVKNRLGMLKDSGEILNNLHQEYKENAENVYPIQVSLKQSLFDPVAAQQAFKKSLFLEDKYKYGLLFYYAPYHLYNTSQTINYITKGAKKVDIDNTISGMGYLENSKAISKSNIAIAEALKKIIDHKIYEANMILQNAIALYPTHATLHYNLGLSYAQLFNFQKAYEHFSKSYSLDIHNHYALAFKSFCAKLVDKPLPEKEIERVKIDIDDKKILSLFEIALGGLGLDLGYLSDETEGFSNAIDLIFAYNRSDGAHYKQAADNLVSIMPNDLVSKILRLDASNDNNNIKAYANTIQKEIAPEDIDMNILYFGGFLPKELYIRMLNIAGIVPSLETKLLDYANTQQPNVSLLQSIAYTQLFTNDFDKSYILYNELIDTYGQRDTHTLFLASVASIGANHHANAVALLELAKLTDEANYESRYALGLLYHEAKNLEGASIQYNKIGNTGFNSNYFTFSLKK